MERETEESVSKYSSVIKTQLDIAALEMEEGQQPWTEDGL